MTSDTRATAEPRPPPAVVVDGDGISVLGRRFRLSISAAALTDLLGPPSRSVLSLPDTPYGHKSPVRHYYDASGVSFLESHKQDAIVECHCAVGNQSPRFRTAQPCSGVRIEEQILTGSTSADELQRMFGERLRRIIRGEYVLNDQRYYISISVRGAPSRVVSVSIGLLKGTLRVGR